MHLYFSLYQIKIEDEPMPTLERQESMPISPPDEKIPKLDVSLSEQ